MIEALFTRSHRVGSYIIRTASWSNWSHVDLILPSGSLIGSAAPHGVVISDFEHRLNISSAAAIVTYTGDIYHAERWARSQLGKPYDWFGVAGLGLHRDWERDGMWWCSEFVAKALKEGGHSPYRCEVMNRITPQHLFMLNNDVRIIK